MLFTGPETTSGVIYSWIQLTAPFTAKIGHYIPAIENYTNQLSLRAGESWRIPRITHLCSVMWFVNLFLAPILFSNIIWGASRAPQAFLDNVLPYKNNRYITSCIKHYSKLLGSLVIGIVVVAICIKVSIYGITIGYGSYGRKVELLIAIAPQLTFFCMFVILLLFAGLLTVHYHFHIRPIINLFNKNTTRS